MSEEQGEKRKTIEDTAEPESEVPVAEPAAPEAEPASSKPEFAAPEAETLAPEQKPETAVPEVEATAPKSKPELAASKSQPAAPEPEPEAVTPELEPIAASTPQPETAPKTKPEPEKSKMSEPPVCNENEIVAEQFENYLRIAQALMKTLKRPKDIEICTNLLRKVQRLNDSKFLEVKRNNNAFFRYCLKVLKWTSDNQPTDLYECWYPTKDTPENITESRTWLEDNKSYVALKVLQGGANLIYAAVATDPSAGWQDGGLNILAKASNCEKPLIK